MSRRKCCFLSMDDMGGYVSDDELAIGPLGERGWDVSTISWRNGSVDWNDFDVVVLRTTWDYQREPELFLEILGRIDASRARLENPLDIVRWNLDKRYLRELEMRGVCIVPTIWDAQYDEASFVGWLKRFATDELIIKPTVSATAEHTYRLPAFDPSLKEVFGERQFMVQPFMHGIVDEGEFSLFYFNGEYSHAILKAPKTKDFRVQEEHGGIITAVESTIEMRAAAESALRQVRQSLLYARIDLVRDENEFRLMELELIEPALYLRMDAGAPKRFASAIDALMNRSKSYDGAEQHF